MKSTLLSLLLSLYSIVSFAQFEPADYMINGYTLPYQVMFPENYEEGKKYPLVIFLHGAGEKGNDNEKQLTHGKDFLINNFYSAYPAIVIAPQCPADSYWSNVERHTLKGKMKLAFGFSDKPTLPMETLIYLINDYLNSNMVDPERVYAGGLSMGGMGTFELVWRMPYTFAAAFPICGGGDIMKLIQGTGNTALWIFHGAEDSVVPVQFSRLIEMTMNDAGYKVKYTEYPGVNHNSWDNVFQEKELVPWLFSHKIHKESEL